MSFDYEDKEINRFQAAGVNIDMQRCGDLLPGQSPEIHNATRGWHPESGVEGTSEG